MMRVKRSVGTCEMAVVGLDMQCPLCRQWVQSGQRHVCVGPCEWNPKEDREAHGDEDPHAAATWSLGTGDRNIHVCDSCARLPAFARLRYRVRLNGSAVEPPARPEGAVPCPQDTEDKRH